jgi:ABC-2 type transport system permease protein
MSTQSDAVPETTVQSRGLAPEAISPAHLTYWSILREFWENRSIYIGPLAAAGVFLLGFLINLIALRRGSHGAWPLDPAQLRHVLKERYELSAALIMGTALIVGIFYSLDALYGERRDRSILFWKSLPVSDVITVLSKFAVPILILPLLSFAITLATQFLMLVLSSAILAGSGVNIATLWTNWSFINVSLVILYHLLTVHGLWYAPLYGWLFLISAWAPRAPFIWAVLPPFVICGVERIAFNTSHGLSLLQNRLLGPGGAMAPEHEQTDLVATLIPQHFFSEPGLWIGLAFAAAFLFGAVRLRRYRGPI